MDNDVQTKRINVEVSQSLHRQLKVAAARKDTAIKEIVVEALRNYLSDGKRKEA